MNDNFQAIAAQLLNKADDAERRTLLNLMALTAKLSKSQRKMIATLNEHGSCFYLAGRRTGKTQSAVVWSLWFALLYPGSTIAFMSLKDSDAKAIVFNSKDFGLTKKLIDPRLIVKSDARINEIVLRNGSSFRSFSAQSDSGPRGSAIHLCVLDEGCHFPDYEAVSNLLIAAPRAGAIPRQVLITTTPSKDFRSETQKFIRGLDYPEVKSKTQEILHLQDPGFQAYYHRIRKTMPMLAKREFDAEITDFSSDSIMNKEQLEAAKMKQLPTEPYKDQLWRNLPRRVISVDPSGTEDADSGRSETGILVIGSGDSENGNVVWCLGDHSHPNSPEEWMPIVSKLYHEYNCEGVLFETNFGKMLGTYALQLVDDTIPILSVNAHKSKGDRAAVITALAVQERIGFHGETGELERQLIEFSRKDHKKQKLDRMDAFSQACHYLAESEDDMDFDIV